MHILNLIERKLYPNRWLGCIRSAVRYITAHKQSLLFWSRLFTTEPKYPKGCCPHDFSLTNKIKLCVFTKIQVMAFLVAVTSECRVKRVIYKTWTGTLANSTEPAQTQQKGLHCLLTGR